MLILRSKVSVQVECFKNAYSFTFREDMGVEVMFGSTTYGAGNNVLTVELSQYQAIVVQDRGQADLTGERVR